MKTLTKHLSFFFLAFCFTLLFGTALLSAQTKPNFSGNWELNVGKSDLGGAPITRLAVQVEHKDPIFKYTAKGVADGQDFEETETLSTDGKPGHDSRGANVKTYWDGATLVSEATGDGDKPFYEARLTISADGKSITRDFIRKSADDPQKRHEIYEKQ